MVILQDFFFLFCVLRYTEEKLLSTSALRPCLGLFFLILCIQKTMLDNFLLPNQHFLVNPCQFILNFLKTQFLLHVSSVDAHIISKHRGHTCHQKVKRFRLLGDLGVQGLHSNSKHSLLSLVIIIRYFLRLSWLLQTGNLKFYILSTNFLTI